MSRIFEALQYAEKERVERNLSKLQNQQQRFQTRHLASSPPAGITNSTHTCLEYAVRVDREGLQDSIYRIAGFYPWQCTRCLHCFRLYKRK
jgi:hypothetical protein